MNHTIKMHPFDIYASVMLCSSSIWTHPTTHPSTIEISLISPTTAGYGHRSYSHKIACRKLKCVHITTDRKIDWPIENSIPIIPAVSMETRPCSNGEKKKTTTILAAV